MSLYFDCVAARERLPFDKYKCLCLLIAMQAVTYTELLLSYQMRQPASGNGRGHVTAHRDKKPSPTLHVSVMDVEAQVSVPATTTDVGFFLLFYYIELRGAGRERAVLNPRVTIRNILPNETVPYDQDHFRASLRHTLCPPTCQKIIPRPPLLAMAARTRGAKENSRCESCDPLVLQRVKDTSDHAMPVVLLHTRREAGLLLEGKF